MKSKRYYQEMHFRLAFPKVRRVVFVILFFLVSFGGGYYFGVQGFRAEITKALRVNIVRAVPPDKNVDFSLFWQVWDTLGAKYYDKGKLVPSQMVYGAIEGMVSSLGDPYSMFLPPNQNKIVNEDLSGSFEGIGIEIGYKNTRLAVISPLPSSPAEKAGVKPGDYIVHITDTGKGVDVDATNLSLAEAVSDIRGPAGSRVTLTLVRDGNPNPIIVELSRVKLNVPSVTLKYVGNDSAVADIKIAKFGAETNGEWEKAVSEVQGNSKVKGIIIDLRNNPGGYLQSAIDLASDFVSNGNVVVIQQNGDGTKEEFKSQKFGRLQKYKVVVLINGGSASASEILAGALRDDRGIKLIGEKSFGKGTIQEPIEIPGGSGLHVTTAKWLTPSGTWVHEKGLTPDIVVVAKDGDISDVQLDAAIKILQ